MGTWCYIKNSKTFLYQQKPKSIVQICCRLSPQCTETIDEYLWPQMDLAKVGCNLNEKIRLTVFNVQGLAFSFLKCTRAGHEVVLSRVQLISFS